MEKANHKTEVIRLEIIYKALFTFCALCCFAAVLPLPISYYTFLRIIVFTAAAITVYHFGRQKEFKWVVVFGIVLILFNPIIPVHFYLKSIWIPIDIVTGILFLLLIFIRKKVNEIPQENIQETSTQQKTYSRDRIIKTSSKKNNNNE
jgi:hypothetical protein